MKQYQRGEDATQVRLDVLAFSHFCAHGGAELGYRHALAGVDLEQGVVVHQAVLSGIAAGVVVRKQSGKGAHVDVAVIAVELVVVLAVEPVVVVAATVVLHVQPFPTEETCQEVWLDSNTVVHQEIVRKSMTWRKCLPLARDGGFYRARSRRVTLPPLPSNNGHEAQGPRDPIKISGVLARRMHSPRRESTCSRPHMSHTLDLRRATRYCLYHSER